MRLFLDEGLVDSEEQFDQFPVRGVGRVQGRMVDCAHEFVIDFREELRTALGVDTALDENILDVLGIEPVDLGLVLLDAIEDGKDGEFEFLGDSLYWLALGATVDDFGLDTRIDHDDTLLWGMVLIIRSKTKKPTSCTTMVNAFGSG